MHNWSSSPAIIKSEPVHTPYLFTSLWGKKYKTQKETNKKAQAFEKITMATTFKFGQGLPGRVWKDNKPCWVEDVTVDPNFPRAKHAKDIGVRCGLAFPVYTSEKLKYVFEIFSLKNLILRR